jgi:hypothetical protein
LSVWENQPISSSSYTPSRARSNGHRSPIQSLDRIAEWPRRSLRSPGAADTGARKSRGLEFADRGRGFTDADPTGSAALDQTRAQIEPRPDARLILRAETSSQ